MWHGVTPPRCFCLPAAKNNHTQESADHLKDVCKLYQTFLGAGTGFILLYISILLDINWFVAEKRLGTAVPKHTENAKSKSQGLVTAHLMHGITRTPGCQI